MLSIRVNQWSVNEREYGRGRETVFELCTPGNSELHTPSTAVLLSPVHFEELLEFAAVILAARKTLTLKDGR